MEADTTPLDEKPDEAVGQGDDSPQPILPTMIPASIPFLLCEDPDAGRTVLHCYLALWQAESRAEYPTAAELGKGAGAKHDEVIGALEWLRDAGVINQGDVWQVLKEAA